MSTSSYSWKRKLPLKVKRNARNTTETWSTLRYILIGKEAHFDLIHKQSSEMNTMIWTILENKKAFYALIGVNDIEHEGQWKYFAEKSEFSIIYKKINYSLEFLFRPSCCLHQLVLQRNLGSFWPKLRQNLLPLSVATSWLQCKELLLLWNPNFLNVIRLLLTDIDRKKHLI